MEAKAKKIDIRSIWRFLSVWTIPAVVFLVALSLCFTALRLDPLVSAMLWVALLIGPGTLLLRWIHDFRRGFDGQDMADIVILLFSAGFAFVSAYLGNEGLTLTYLFEIILNLTVGRAFDLGMIANLQWWTALVVFAISILLTVIAGLIPSRAAAKQDPVNALRTE